MLISKLSTLSSPSEARLRSYYYSPPAAPSSSTRARPTLKITSSSRASVGNSLKLAKVLRGCDPEQEAEEEEEEKRKPSRVGVSRYRSESIGGFSAGSLLEGGNSRPTTSDGRSLRSILKMQRPQSTPTSTRSDSSSVKTETMYLVWAFSQRGSQECFQPSLLGTTPPADGPKLVEADSRRHQVTFQRDENLKSVHEFPSPRSSFFVRSSLSQSSNSLTTTANWSDSSDSLHSGSHEEEHPYVPSLCTSGWDSRRRGGNTNTNTSQCPSSASNPDPGGAARSIFRSRQSTSSHSTNSGPGSERFLGPLRRLFMRRRRPDATTTTTVLRHTRIDTCNLHYFESPACSEAADEDYIDITDDGSSFFGGGGGADEPAAAACLLERRHSGPINEAIKLSPPVPLSD